MSQYSYMTIAPHIRNCSCAFNTLKRKFWSSITDSLNKVTKNINQPHQENFKQILSVTEIQDYQKYDATTAVLCNLKNSPPTYTVLVNTVHSSFHFYYTFH